VARKSKIETEKQADGSAALKPKRKKVTAKKKTAPKKGSSPASVPEPTDEAIRIRAYFIAERRIQLSLQGDSAHDWIEARRQLIEEARAASS
jgi:hypothetical protein